ncbi:MAG: aspartate-semialdehyde dehydrogenase, partial [Planctomycetes bacterium]|nr:aspartate-semialdehyde dehydrogenase [Planctomycetota bacterium]
VFPFPIAFNCLPHVDSFERSGYTREEMKMVHETRKILGDSALRVSATCVRVPVFRSHSEAVTLETEQPITPDEAREILAAAPGVRVVDDPDRRRGGHPYPMPLEATGRDEVHVGRIRADLAFENGLSMWVVADQLRKGAATNAVQIAERL